MSDHPDRRELPGPAPHITVLPHISAPIDEGPLFPKPPMRLRDKALIVIGLVTFAALVLGYTFYRATALQ